ncbi:unnamed protein product, partial [Discosporangium mesarthrocarpum]
LEVQQEYVLTLTLTLTLTPQVIKEVRAVTGLGLKEAKDAVEALPQVIKKDVKKEEAEEIVEKLKAAGGEVELE